MKKFIYNLFAGIGIFFVTVVFLAVLAISWGHKPQRAELPDKMVLALNLDQGLKENDSSQNLMGLLEGEQEGLSLQEIIQTLDQARLDQRVQGLTVNIEDGDFGLANVQELRNAIQRFRRSGKFAYLYANTLGQHPAMAEYWLASAFDKIWLQPLGELAITGFGAEMPFGRELLDKVGVEPELLHVGKYKSFPEMAMRDSASPENRAMTEDMLRVLARQFASDVAQARHIPITKVQQLMQDSPLSAQQARADKLIDAVGYPDEFEGRVEQVTKGGDPVEFTFYQQNGPRPVPGEKMALIKVIGALASRSDADAMTHEVAIAEDVVQAIQDAVDQKHIKAIVVRLDSPGGTPLAADMIRRAIVLAHERKPVVISMSNTAASGGYWMSVNADKIVAQPATLTGSIGVFGGKFNLAALWKKAGVRWEEIPSNGQQNMWSINQPYSAESRAKVQQRIQETYDIFISHVASGRKMKRSRVEELAQGRVWTGEQAKANGLVDALGGIDVAVNLARELAKVPTGRNVNLESFPKEKTLFEQIFEMFSRGAPLHVMTAWMQKSIALSLQQWLQTNIRV